MSFSFDYDCKKCPRLFDFLKNKEIDFDNLDLDSIGKVSYLIKIFSDVQ